jgi:hypothetical protein
MNKTLFILATVLSVIVHGQCGTIFGTVRAQGKEGAEASASSGGKYESRQFKLLERVNYEEMHDFIVYIEGPVGPPPATHQSHRKARYSRPMCFR